MVNASSSSSFSYKHWVERILVRRDEFGSLKLPPTGFQCRRVIETQPSSPGMGLAPTLRCRSPLLNELKSTKK